MEKPQKVPPLLQNFSKQITREESTNTKILALKVGFSKVNTLHFLEKEKHDRSKSKTTK